MIKWIGAILALCTAASGGSITYDYTGDDFNDCNGLAAANGNCPANYTSDYVTLSLSRSAHHSLTVCRRRTRWARPICSRGR